jgi:hypothetical protein
MKTVRTTCSSFVFAKFFSPVREDFFGAQDIDKQGQQKSLEKTSNRAAR